MSLVVSDTSPIRALEYLGRVDILASIFGRVILPPAVADELRNPRSRFRAIDVGQHRFIDVRAPSDQAAVAELAGELGPGESEAIVLAGELSAELLIDESAGRAEARRRGVRVVGAIGILVRAKQRGLVPAVLPLLQQLRTELGFYLSEQLIELVQRQTGE